MERRPSAQGPAKAMNVSRENFSAEQTIQRGGAVYALVANILMATRIAQAAKHCHLSVHNFDKAAALMTHALQKAPILVVLDWDACEAEAFKVLKEMGTNADLKGVPVIGFISQSKAVVKEEARRAGCHRVYTKTEFQQELEMLLTRYAR